MIHDRFTRLTGGAVYAHMLGVETLVRRHHVLNIEYPFVWAFNYFLLPSVPTLAFKSPASPPYPLTRRKAPSLIFDNVTDIRKLSLLTYGRRLGIHAVSTAAQVALLKIRRASKARVAARIRRRRRLVRA